MVGTVVYLRRLRLMLVDVGWCWVMRFVLDLYRDMAHIWLMPALQARPRLQRDNERLAPTRQAMCLLVLQDG